MKRWENPASKRVQVLCRDIHKQADHLEKLQPLVQELQAELRMAGDETRASASPHKRRDENPYDKIMMA
jgi:hypothetical protein